MKKTLIIGGNAGGASAAARLRRLDEDMQIQIIERGPQISYSNCSLPFYLGGTVEDSDDLVNMTPKGFKNRYNIDVATLREALSIDRENKEVLIRDLENDTTYKESYDKLILAPGAAPIVPDGIDGADGPNVFTVRNVQDIIRLDTFVKRRKIRRVVVAGGGFIGVEITENLVRAGKKAILVENRDQILMPYDEDMVQILHKEMRDNKVELILGDSVNAIESDKVVLASGKIVKAEAVILAAGVRPETKLAKEAGLEIGETGGILINVNCQTSDPDIYAVGDAVEVYHALTHKKIRHAMAGPAQWQARNAADHICGRAGSMRGVIGSSVLRVFGLNAACTGLNERECRKAGIPCDFAFVLPSDKVGIMPDSGTMLFKLVFEVPTGRILGAQAIDSGEVDKRINVIAAMIRMNGTIYDLKDLELCYSPLFSTAKDVVNYAALVAINILEHRYEQVPVSKVRELVESGAYIIDVREPKEFSKGHLRGAVNIPLSKFRENIDKIPKDRDVYLHCRSSQRSYNAVMALKNRGYDRVYNISGSFLGICLYEYFRDKTEGRKPIVTKYNFN